MTLFFYQIKLCKFSLHLPTPQIDVNKNMNIDIKQLEAIVPLNHFLSIILNPLDNIKVQLNIVA